MLRAMTDVSSTPYRVLARKYRPTGFAHMIGQEAMVRTLTNAVNCFAKTRRHGNQRRRPGAVIEWIITSRMVE